MKIAIIGAGKMGVWFAKYCKAKGDTVVLADRNPVKLAKLRDELGVEVDEDKKAIYWRQIRNGMWLRVALISTIFSRDKAILSY